MKENEIKKLIKITKFNIKECENEYILSRLNAMIINLKSLDDFSPNDILYNIEEETF